MSIEATSGNSRDRSWLYISPHQDEYARSATIWERVTAQIGVEPELQLRAASELRRRLSGWHGDYLPRHTRFKNRTPIDRGDHLIVPADPVELIIVRAVAMTKGAAQFGVSPNGAILPLMEMGGLFMARELT